VSVPTSELGSPTPSPVSECVPHPGTKGGGGEGMGESPFRRLEKKPSTTVLYYSVLAGIFASSLVKTAITTLLLVYYILLLWSSLSLPVGKTVRGQICERLRSPGLNSMEPIPRTGLCDNHNFCSSPPGYIGWLNRFLGSLKVYKFGLRAEF
jgi:hypothetical protein